MTPTEQQFILWAIGTLLAILGFIGVLAVNTLIKMNNNLNKLNVTVATIVEKQEAHEEAHKELKARVYELEHA
jgi:hypothetical protein